MARFARFIPWLLATAFSASVAAANFAVESQAFLPDNATRTAKPAAVARAQPGRVKPILLDAPPSLQTVLSASTSGKEGRPPVIGFSRAVASLSDEASVQSLLDWDRKADGSSVAAISITSPDASAVRVGFKVGALPAGLVLRFYAPTGGDVFEVSGDEVAATLALNAKAGETDDNARTYWSPVVESSTIVVEAEIPAAARSPELRISMPLVSHLFTSPAKDFVMPKAAAACEIDATCYASTWPEVSAVARMLFSDGTFSYYCTGTLLNDADITTAIPYFLSANHCINTQSAASTLQTYWFYRSTACNSGIAGAYQTRTGGATLLYHAGITDTSFMRLNVAPPAGVWLAGWSSAPPVVGAALTGLHHPAGDLLKISFANMNGYWICTPSGTGSDTFSCSTSTLAAATFYGITFTGGVTEGGSSGSAIYDSGHHVIGQLYGGSSSCGFPGGGDFYGRFDMAFNATGGLAQWLNVVPQQALTVAKAGTGSGTVTGGGINCGATCSVSVAPGTAVTLSAAAAAGSSFAGWSGACSGTLSCNVTVNAATSVTATFNLIPPPRKVVQDFDFDGRSDVILQDSGTGVASVLLMNGVTVGTNTPLGVPGVGDTITQTGDLDGDGKADVVVRGADGSIQLWLMNGTTVAQQTTLLPAGSGWSVTQTGDFNGDGKMDLVLTRSDGLVYVLLMNGFSVVGGGLVLPPGSGWSVSHVADFNGDGKSDLLLKHTDGWIYVMLMNGGAMADGGLLIGSGGWSATATGDFDGDGKADILVTNTDGTVVMLQMNGSSAASYVGYMAAGGPWSIARVADLNGDGKADIIWQHTDGTHYAWIMGGTTTLLSQGVLWGAGTGYTISEVLDLNGDGKMDLLLRNAGSGAIDAALMDGATITSRAMVPRWGAQVARP